MGSCAWSNSPGRAGLIIPPGDYKSHEYFPRGARAVSRQDGYSQAEGGAGLVATPAIAAPSKP